MLGLASLALGVHQISKGFGHLGELSPPRKREVKKLPRVPEAKKKGSRGRKSPAALQGAAPKGKKQQNASGMEVSLKEVRSLDERVKHIQDKIRKGKTDPVIYNIARKVVSKKCGDKFCIPEKDNLAEAKAIFDYTRKNVRYVSDPIGIDAYAAPKHTISMASGDCDDHSITNCSLLLSIGIPCKLKVIQTVGSNEPNHIYAVAGLPRAAPKQWYPMDTTMAKPFGWEAPKSMVQKSWLYPAEG